MRQPNSDLMFIAWMMNELLNVCWRMSCWCQHARIRANPNLNSSAKVSHLLFFFVSPLLKHIFPPPSFSSHLLPSMPPSFHTATMHTPYSCSLCVLSQLVCMPAAATSLSLEIKERSWCVCWELERKKGEERGRRGGDVMETERYVERGIGMPQGEMKRRRKKITKGWERWRKSSIDVLSSQPARLYSISLPLPSVVQTVLSLWQR